jgi:hypothetical protein
MNTNKNMNISTDMNMDRDTDRGRDTYRERNVITHCYRTDRPTLKSLSGANLVID